MASSSNLAQLRDEYLASKAPYNKARARVEQALAAEMAAADQLRASRDAFVAAGGVLADLPPAQPEVDTPPTTDEEG